MYAENDKDILNRMINNVPSDVDKSEGSLIYDAMSPSSKEIAQQEINLDQLLNRVFAITAAKNGYSEELEYRCAEFGVERKPGITAQGEVIFKGADGTVIPSNTIVQTPGGLKFVTTEDGTISETLAKVNIKASQIGTQYNIPAGQITGLPVQITGISSLSNESATSGGTDPETDSELLQRFLTQVKTPSTSGNTGDYMMWATQVNGVGAAKVFPLWNGNGTVKVVIIDSDKRAANDELIDMASKNIEENRPIGAQVTVVSAKEQKIDVSAKLSLAAGYTLQQIQDNFNSILVDYFKGIAFKDTYVSYAKIGNILLNVNGILDYSGLALNSQTSNIPLQDDEIPVLGGLSLGV